MPTTPTASTICGPCSCSKRRRVDVYLDEPTSRADACPLRLLLRDAAGQRISADRHREALGRRASRSRSTGRAARSRLLPVLQDHGDIPSLGFRFGNVAYSARHQRPAAPTVLRRLAGLDVWIVDALRRTPHPSHFHLDEALDWIARIKPKRAILTNLHTDLDYATLCAELPPDVEPGYDRMSFAC